MVYRYPATILIPLLRQRDEWLRHSIMSALTQTVRCEVLVVTAPNTPASNLSVVAELQARSSHLTVVRSRSGFGMALNAGFRSAAAERIGLLLSDDWLERGCVEECLGFDTDIVSTGMRSYAADGVTEFPALRKLITRQAFDARSSLEAKADYLSHFFLLKRRTLLEVGGADESVGDAPGVDDYDLIWVLLEHGAMVRVVEMFLYNRRDHAGERLTTRSKEELLRTLGAILSKHGIDGEEKARLLAQKGRWLGRPVHVVRAELAGVNPPSGSGSFGDRAPGR